MTQATDYDKVSSAYASALVELAQEKNALDTVHADVDSLQVRSGRAPGRSWPLLLFELRSAFQGNLRPPSAAA